MSGDAIIDRRETRAALAIAAVAFTALALRACIGASLYDDTYYVTTAVRFAEGARPLADELSLQALGQLVAVPFVALWRAAFGLTGIMLAVRLYYVLLATAAAVTAHRLLRPTTGSAAAAAAVALPLLAPVYHLIAPSYNTMAALAFMLAVAFAFGAVRDGTRTLAACAGVAAALGSLSHPPMVLAALVLLATFAAVARDRRLALAMLAGALVSGAVIALGLFSRVSPGEVRTALAFASANVEAFASPLQRAALVASHAVVPLLSPWLVPMWLLVVVSSPGRSPARVREVAFAAVPAAAAIPGFALLASGDHFTFGTAAASWLFTATAGLAVPAMLWARRSGRGDLLRLAALSGPSSLAGYAILAYVTNSSWNRAAATVALAPLAMCLLAIWGAALVDARDVRLLLAGAAGAFAVAMVLLFATVWADAPITAPRALVDHGPYGGLWVSEARRRQLLSLEEAGARWVRPTGRVGFMGERQGYLLVGGTIHTNAVWLLPSPADRAVLDYYDRDGMPDVMFIDGSGVAEEGGYGAAPSRDPLLARVVATYRRVAEVAGFAVFVKP